MLFKAQLVFGSKLISKLGFLSLSNSLDLKPKIDLNYLDDGNEQLSFFDSLDLNKSLKLLPPSPNKELLFNASKDDFNSLDKTLLLNDKGTSFTGEL